MWRRISIATPICGRSTSAIRCTGLNSTQLDLGLADVVLNGVAQPIVVTTGRRPLAIYNPQIGGDAPTLPPGAPGYTPGPGRLYNGDIVDASGTVLTSWGWAVEAGTLLGRPIALISAAIPSGATI